MAALDYPEGVLPLPLFAGYVVQPQDNVLRTQMEKGPARQRVTATNVPERIRATFPFNKDQYTIFRSWRKHKAKFGSVWFNITLLNAMGMVSHEARFVSQGDEGFSASPSRSERWHVTLVLEVRNSPDLTEDALDASITLGGDVSGFVTAVTALNVAINTTIPTDPW